MKNLIIPSITKRSHVSVSVMLITLFFCCTLSIAGSLRGGTGEVIAVRNVVLKDSVDIAEFEKFVIEDYNPAFEGVFPGMKMSIAKSDRGNNLGSYVHLLIIDSQKVRDLLFPEGQISEWLEKVMNDNNWQQMSDKLGAFCVEDWANKYNDYVVLR